MNITRDCQAQAERTLVDIHHNLKVVNEYLTGTRTREDPELDRIFREAVEYQRCPEDPTTKYHKNLVGDGVYYEAMKDLEARQHVEYTPVIDGKCGVCRRQLQLRLCNL